MAIRLTGVDEAIEYNGVKMLVFGRQGTGKTTLGASAAAKGVKTLIINVEAGLKSIKKISDEAKQNIKVATIDGIDDLKTIHGWLMEDNPYGLIVLDSITEIAEVCLSEQKAGAADPRQAYGALADIIKDLLRSYRDLPNTNVLMIAKLTTDDINGVKINKPSMPGNQLKDGIGYMFDEVYCTLCSEDDSGEETVLRYYMQVAPDISNDCKSRDGSLGRYVNSDLFHVLTMLGADFKMDAPQRPQQPQPPQPKDTTDGKLPAKIEEQANQLAEEIETTTPNTLQELQNQVKENN